MTTLYRLVDGKQVALKAAEAAEIEAERASPPPAPVPRSVTRFQAKAALASAGFLDAVEAAISGADLTARLAWSDALEFERDSPTIAALAGALKLSSEQVDDLFRLASTIKA